MTEDGDVPSPIDFHDLEQAQAWIADTIRKRPWRPTFFRAFCSALSQPSGAPMSALELGSGPGHLAREILRHGRVHTYVALDFSAAMHRLAREHLDELSARVTFVQKDFRSPQWPDALGTFDAVVHKLVELGTIDTPRSMGRWSPIPRTRDRISCSPTTRPTTDLSATAEPGSDTSSPVAPGSSSFVDNLKRWRLALADRWQEPR